jgi:hypothetical protein
MSYWTRRARLERLQRRARPRERCPDCPPVTFVETDENGDPHPGFAFPEPCRTCGGPYDGGIQFIEVVTAAAGAPQLPA